MIVCNHRGDSAVIIGKWNIPTNRKASKKFMKQLSQPSVQKPVASTPKLIKQSSQPNGFTKIKDNSRNTSPANSETGSVVSSSRVFSFKQKKVPRVKTYGTFHYSYFNLLGHDVYRGQIPGDKSPSPSFSIGSKLITERHKHKMLKKAVIRLVKSRERDKLR